MKQLIEKYQCPGCSNGYSTRCGRFKENNNNSNTCFNYHPEIFDHKEITFPGLPLGINKIPKRKGSLRIWEENTKPEWNEFNAPVAMKQHGNNLIVKTIMPKTMITFVDVIQNADNNLVEYIKNVNPKIKVNIL